DLAQLATDHLLGDLGDQFQQLLAPALLERGHGAVELGNHPLQRGAGGFKLSAALGATFFQALGQAFLQTAFVTVRVAGFGALRQAFLIAAFLALLITVGQGALQRGRIAVQLLLHLGAHCAAARRKAVDAPGASAVLDHSYRHALTYSTVCSRNNWICSSPSAAMSRTTPMMSLRTCSTRLSGTGPWRRLMDSICCA